MLGQETTPEIKMKRTFVTHSTCNKRIEISKTTTKIDR